MIRLFNMYTGLFEGSKRQRDWADDIREKIASCAQDICYDTLCSKNAHEIAVLCAKMQTLMREYRDAKWWIDRRDWDMEQFLQLINESEISEEIEEQEAKMKKRIEILKLDDEVNANEVNEVNENNVNEKVVYVETYDDFVERMEDEGGCARAPKLIAIKIVEKTDDEKALDEIKNNANSKDYEVAKAGKATLEAVNAGKISAIDALKVLEAAVKEYYIERGFSDGFDKVEIKLNFAEVTTDNDEVNVNEALRMDVVSDTGMSMKQYVERIRRDLRKLDKNLELLGTRDEIGDLRRVCESAGNMYDRLDYLYMLWDSFDKK